MQGRRPGQQTVAPADGRRAGGNGRGRAALEAWFARLFRLFDLSFDVRRVVVAGRPWSLRVTVEWVATVQPVAGPAYENVGVHVLAFRGRRVVSIHAYEDSQAVAEACRQMAALGVAEAAAAPITGRLDPGVRSVVPPSR